MNKKIAEMQESINEEEQHSRVKRELTVRYNYKEQDNNNNNNNNNNLNNRSNKTNAMQRQRPKSQPPIKFQACGEIRNLLLDKEHQNRALTSRPNCFSNARPIPRRMTLANLLEQDELKLLNQQAQSDRLSPLSSISSSTSASLSSSTLSLTTSSGSSASTVLAVSSGSERKCQASAMNRRASSSTEDEDLEASYQSSSCSSSSTSSGVSSSESGQLANGTKSIRAKSTSGKPAKLSQEVHLVEAFPFPFPFQDDCLLPASSSNREMRQLARDMARRMVVSKLRLANSLGQREPGWFVSVSVDEIEWFQLQEQEKCGQIIKAHPQTNGRIQSRRQVVDCLQDHELLIWLIECETKSGHSLSLDDNEKQQVHADNPSPVSSLAHEDQQDAGDYAQSSGGNVIGVYGTNEEPSLKETEAGGLKLIVWLCASDKEARDLHGLWHSAGCSVGCDSNCLASDGRKSKHSEDMVSVAPIDGHQAGLLGTILANVGDGKEDESSAVVVVTKEELSRKSVDVFVADTLTTEESTNRSLECIDERNFGLLDSSLGDSMKIDDENGNGENGLDKQQEEHQDIDDCALESDDHVVREAAGEQSSPLGSVVGSNTKQSSGTTKETTLARPSSPVNVAAALANEQHHHMTPTLYNRDRRDPSSLSATGELDSVVALHAPNDNAESAASGRASKQEHQKEKIEIKPDQATVPAVKPRTSILKRQQQDRGATIEKAKAPKEANGDEEGSKKKANFPISRASLLNRSMKLVPLFQRQKSIPKKSLEEEQIKPEQRPTLGSPKASARAPISAEKLAKQAVQSRSDGALGSASSDKTALGSSSSLACPVGSSGMNCSNHSPTKQRELKISGHQLRGKVVDGPRANCALVDNGLAVADCVDEEETHLSSSSVSSGSTNSGQRATKQANSADSGRLSDLTIAELQERSQAAPNALISATDRQKQQIRDHPDDKLKQASDQRSAKILGTRKSVHLISVSNGARSQPDQDGIPKFKKQLSASKTTVGEEEEEERGGNSGKEKECEKRASQVDKEAHRLDSAACHSDNREQAFERLRLRASCYDITRLMSKNNTLQSQLAKLRTISESQKQAREANLRLHSTSNQDDKEHRAPDEGARKFSIRKTDSGSEEMITEHSIAGSISRSSRCSVVLIGSSGRPQDRTTLKKISAEEEEREEVKSKTLQPVRRQKSILKQTEPVVRVKSPAKLPKEEDEKSMSEVTASDESDTEVEESGDRAESDELKEAPKLSKFSLLRQSFNQKTLSSMLKFSSRASMRIKAKVAPKLIADDKLPSKIEPKSLPEAASKGEGDSSMKATKIPGSIIRSSKQKQFHEEQLMAQAGLMITSSQQHIQQQHHQQQLIQRQQQQQMIYQQHYAAALQQHQQQQVMMQRQQQQYAAYAYANQYVATQQALLLQSVISPGPVGPPPPGVMPVPQIGHHYQHHSQQMLSLIPKSPQSIARSNIKRSDSRIYSAHMPQPQQHPIVLPMAMVNHQGVNVVYATPSQINQTHETKSKPVATRGSSTLGASMRKTVRSILTSRASNDNERQSSDKQSTRSAIENQQPSHLKSALKSPKSTPKSRGILVNIKSNSTSTIALNSEGSSDGDQSSSTVEDHFPIRQQQNGVTSYPKSVLKKTRQSYENSSSNQLGARSSIQLSSTKSSEKAQIVEKSSEDAYNFKRSVASRSSRRSRSPTRLGVGSNGDNFDSDRRMSTKTYEAPNQKRNVTFSTKLTTSIA